MRIVHVLPALSKGGGERVAVDLANSAAAEGHQVAVVAALAVDESLLRADLLPGVEVRYIADRASRPGRYVRMLFWLWRNRRWLAEQDVVHCHMTFAAAFGTVVHTAKRLAGRHRPAVVETYHAVGMPIPPAHRWLHARMASRRDALALMAEDPYWRAFVEGRPGLPAAVIPNGVVLERRSILEEERLAYRRGIGIPDSCTTLVGTIGRLRTDRRPWLFPRIFGAIAGEAGPGLHFLIGGDGPELKRVEAAVAEHGLKGRVHLVGLVREPAVPLSIMDLYLTLNVGPVTGVAALEAAAAGIPILALQLLDSYEPAEADWIWSSAAPETVAAKAAALLRDEPALRALARLQSAHVRAHHSIEAMARAYQALYGRALAALDQPTEQDQPCRSGTSRSDGT